MKKFSIDKALSYLKKITKTLKEPIVSEVAKNKDAYQILISTIISLRTKDETTRKAWKRLKKVADTPEKMLKLTQQEIERLIYPAGFYRNKARNILKLSQILLERFNGIVPQDMETLLSLPGVGRKTANLVLTEAFNIDAICVDTHVHRISNRWGYVKTRNPIETEMALRKKLPIKHWKEYNYLLVKFGQNICSPIHPKCDMCLLKNMCKYYKTTKA